jgi:hypothetical protein
MSYPPWNGYNQNGQVRTIATSLPDHQYISLKKGECFYMLTDLYFNRKKLSFEESQNLLGMINSTDLDNLYVAETILKNMFKDDIKQF